MTKPAGSVTHWLGLLKAGDQKAAEAIWQRYFSRMVALARQHLQHRAAANNDAEDIAAVAFTNFYNCLIDGRFPQLSDRESLWRMLLTITVRRTRNFKRDATRDKRDASRTRNAMDLFDVPDPDLDLMIGEEPAPEMVVEVTEQLSRLMGCLQDEELKPIVMDLLAGYTPTEIAARQGCSLRTVHRRRERIREIWEVMFDEE